MSRSPRIPSYRLHKASGQAVVTIDRHDFYLGLYGTPESRAEYERVIAEWLASGRRCPTPKSSPGPTVAAVLAAYWTHAEGYYVAVAPDGRERRSPMLSRINRATEPALRLYGGTPAAQFGPLALKTVRQEYVARGFARSEVNQLAGTLRRAFRWAAGEELIPASVYDALATVEGLRSGKCEAHDNPSVEPVPAEHIEPVRRVVLPVVRNLIDLQLLTAARPGELLALRPGEIDRSGSVWLYRPGTHKTAHRGKTRVIFIGPRGQEILGPYLDREPDAWCFSPREAMLRWLADRGRRAVTSATNRYETSSYTRAIRRGCLSAGVPCWRPHRLRHSSATLLKDEFGIEVAMIILGHARLDTTAIYAHENLERAVEVMRKFG